MLQKNYKTVLIQKNFFMQLLILQKPMKIIVLWCIFILVLYHIFALRIQRYDRRSDGKKNECRQQLWLKIGYCRWHRVYGGMRGQAVAHGQSPRFAMDMDRYYSNDESHEYYFGIYSKKRAYGLPYRIE